MDDQVIVRSVLAVRSGSRAQALRPQTFSGSAGHV